MKKKKIYLGKYIKYKIKIIEAFKNKKFDNFANLYWQSYDYKSHLNDRDKKVADDIDYNIRWLTNKMNTKPFDFIKCSNDVPENISDKQICYFLVRKYWRLGFFDLGKEFLDFGMKIEN